MGTSGRVRVVVYNTDEVKESELPDTIAGYTDPRWKGKLGLAPTNASFQAFVTALRLSAGEDAARDLAGEDQGERAQVLREELAGRRGGRCR